MQFSSAGINHRLPLCPHISVGILFHGVAITSGLVQDNQPLVVDLIPVESMLLCHGVPNRQSFEPCAHGCVDYRLAVVLARAASRAVLYCAVVRG